MDPLSIAAGSAGLATSCFKIVSILYAFVDETRSVDENIAALIAEVKGLSQVLDTVSKSLRHNALVGLRGSDDTNLWTMVESSLQECGKTLNKLYTMLQDLNGTAASRFGVLRRPIKQVRLNMKMKDIGDFQQQVHSHYGGMQLTLGTINVCIALHSNSSQQDLTRQLTELRNQISLANNLATRQQFNQPGANPDTAQDSHRISNHLKKLAQDAESLRSSASTVIEGDRSTIWGGSILGDQLSNEQYRDIRNWIPPPVEEGSVEGESIVSGPTSDDHTAHAGSSSDSESDPEQELVAMFEGRGMQRLSDNEYEEAEKYLSKAISLRKPFSNSKITMEHLKANLALAYCYQAKWDDADQLLTSMSDSRNRLDPLAVHSLHAVSIAHLVEGRFDASDRTCRKALLGKKKLLGKTHQSYYQTVQLLASVCDAKGDQVEGDGWRHFLPRQWSPSQQQPDPIEYLEQHTMATPTPPVQPPQHLALLLPQVNTINNSNAGFSPHDLQGIPRPDTLLPVDVGSKDEITFAIRPKPVRIAISDEDHRTAEGNDSLLSPGSSKPGQLLSEAISSASPSSYAIDFSTNEQVDLQFEFQKETKTKDHESTTRPNLPPTINSLNEDINEPAATINFADKVDSDRWSWSDGGNERQPFENSRAVSSSTSMGDTYDPFRFDTSPESKLTLAHNKSLDPPAIQTIPEKICGKCRKALGNPHVKALNNVFHLECFTCHDCGSIVASKFFPVPDEGPNQVPYCERDYFRRLDLLCGGCGEALRGPYVTALDTKYHVEHFGCHFPACGTIFGNDDSYYEHEGRVYCREHFSEQYARKCAQCGEAILAQFFEANDGRKQWHAECYYLTQTH